MLTRAATDAGYAQERGISQATAQSLLDAHKASGAPLLPERVGIPILPPPAKSTKLKKHKLLGAS